MKILKLFPALLILLILIFSGCSGNAQNEINGKSLFDISDSKSVELRIGEQEFTISKQESIDKIQSLFLNMNLKKINPADKEGGITVIFNHSNKNTVVTVCGNLILYNEQWYETSTDISEELNSFVNE